ncbi:MAG: ADP-ribosylglycohydrolase family protein [Deltaproteobacteria bacterium]|nr:ADP-ribosylglycohydrolase family protein [Deltaproteobacteria bacterium]
MLGAIAGDVVGSIHEHARTKTRDFPLFVEACTFTDDTVLTVAVARAILEGTAYRDEVLRLGREHPGAGYGGSFRRWLREEDPQPYGSWGNGSAMRVSPVGLAFTDEASVLREAEKSAAITHDHPEGIKGAQAVALAVFLARQGASKEEIRLRISGDFGHDLTRSVDEIRPGYRFDVSCQGSVPEAILSFLEADDLEGTLRNAISLGGDADTLAAIAGGIAEAFWGGLPRADHHQLRTSSAKPRRPSASWRRQGLR